LIEGVEGSVAFFLLGIDGVAAENVVRRGVDLLREVAELEKGRQITGVILGCADRLAVEAGHELIEIEPATDRGHHHRRQSEVDQVQILEARRASK